MAQGPTRLTVFFGTEAERRYWVRQKDLDDSRVLLARTAGRTLNGRSEPVDTWYCSGHHGLSARSVLQLHRYIALLNFLYEKEAT